MLAIAIKDNGAGFDIPAVTADYEKRGSLGMINMQERTEMINGQLRIHSGVGQGTRVILNLPLSENLQGEDKG